MQGYSRLPQPKPSCWCTHHTAWGKFSAIGSRRQWRPSGSRNYTVLIRSGPPTVQYQSEGIKCAVHRSAFILPFAIGLSHRIQGGSLEPAPRTPHHTRQKPTFASPTSTILNLFFVTMHVSSMPAPGNPRPSSTYDLGKWRLEISCLDIGCNGPSVSISVQPQNTDGMESSS